MTKQLSYTLHELAEKTNTLLEGDGHIQIAGVADLESATASDISFLANPRYNQQMKVSQAGVIVVSKNTERDPKKNFLISDNPSVTFQQIIELFAVDLPPLSGFTEVHESAVIHKTARIGEKVTVAPRAVIDANASIGDGSFIGSGVFVGPAVSIGKECVIHPNVVIREGCVIGDRVVIQPGAVIGSCGFGFATDKMGRHTKLNQIGNVIIGNDVEIGANTTIDRARFKATIIGDGTKIDNLVQIAHGVVVGKHSMIISQVGIAGSTTIGNHVILAGKVAVNGHIKIGDQVIVAACSGVSKSITTPGQYGGVPVMPIKEYNKNAVLLRNMEKFVEDIRELQKLVKSAADQQDTDEQDAD